MNAPMRICRASARSSAMARSPAARRRGTGGRRGWRSGGSRPACPDRRSCPCMQDRHLVGHHLGELHVVGHHDGGVADAGAELGDELGHQPWRWWGRARRWARRRTPPPAPSIEGPRDAHALAHAARQLGGQQLVGAGQPDQVEEAVHAIGDLPEGQARVLAQRERHVLEHGERVEERRALEHEAGAPPQRQHGLLAHPVDARAEHVTSPESGRARPAAMRRSTVLPWPLPPITARIVPLVRAQLTPRRTSFSSNAFQTSRSSTSGRPRAGHRGSPEHEEEEPA